MKHRQNRLIFIWITASLIILCACGQRTSNQDSKVDNSINNANKLTIDTFSTFPPEIDGCSCYFSNDSKEFKKGVYIYIDLLPLTEAL